MLVCNISLRPPRSAIAASIAEATTAVDTAAIVSAVFDGLIDDPAFAQETVDAYLGEIMVEAASASDTVDVGGSTFAVAVDEVVTAGDAVDVGASTYGVAVDETTTATDAPNAISSGAAPTRSAMLPGVFINPGASREAHVIGTMVNL